MMKMKPKRIRLADYPRVTKCDFPKTLHVAYAVCTSKCGAREFIVDGSTQMCQHCGALMFRTEVAAYTLKTLSGLNKRIHRAVHRAARGGRTARRR